LANVFQDASFVVVGKHSLHVDVAHDHHGRDCTTKVFTDKLEHPMIAFLPWNFLLHVTDKAVLHVLVKRIDLFVERLDIHILTNMQSM
jgi:hypothetical protein